MICCLSSSSPTVAEDAADSPVIVVSFLCLLPGPGLAPVDPPDVAVGPPPGRRNEVQNDHGLVDGLTADAERGHGRHAILELLFHGRIDLAAGMAEVPEVGRRRPRRDGIHPD